MTKLLIALGEPLVDKQGYVVSGVVNAYNYFENPSSDAYEVWHKLLWHPALYEAAKFDYERLGRKTSFDDVLSELVSKKLIVIGEDDTPEHAMEKAYVQTRIYRNAFLKPMSADELYFLLRDHGKKGAKVLDYFSYDDNKKQFAHTQNETTFKSLLGWNPDADPSWPDLKDDEASTYLIVFKGYGTLMPVELAWYIQNGYNRSKDENMNKMKMNQAYLKEGQREMSVEDMRKNCGAWERTINAVDSLNRRGMLIFFQKDVVDKEKVDLHDKKDFKGY